MLGTKLTDVSPVLQVLLKSYEKASCELYVSSAYRAGGGNHSGYAVDIIPMRGTMRSLLDCFILATKYPFSGIGIYPYWTYKNFKGGLHLDVSTNRRLKELQSVGYWLGYKDRDLGRKCNGKNIYEAITLSNLSRHGVV